MKENVCELISQSSEHQSDNKPSDNKPNDKSDSSSSARNILIVIFVIAITILI